VECEEGCFDGPVYGYKNSTLKTYAQADDVTYYELESTNFTDDKQFVYTVSGSKATIARYTGSGKYVKVPSSIGSYTVTAIGASAFAQSLVFDVELPGTVMSIGDNAFDLDLVQYEGMPLVLRIPPSVTTIGSNVLPDTFRKVYILTESNISNPVWKILVYPNETLAGDAHWKSGDFGYLFSYKDETETTWEAGVTGYWGRSADVTLPLSIDTYEKGVVQLTGIPEDYCFKGISKLNSITVPEGYTSISYGAFAEGCADHIYLPKSLTQIDALPSDGITYHVYANTEAYLHVVQNNLTHVVTDESSAFAYEIVNDTYAKLTGVNATEENITLPGTLGGKPLTAIGSYAFKGCGAKMIYVPASVSSIADNAFSGIGTAGDVTIVINCDNAALGQNVFDSNAFVLLMGDNDTPVRSYLYNNGVRYACITDNIDGFQVKFENMGFTIQNYTGTQKSITVPDNFYGIPVKKFYGISDNAHVRSVKIADGVTNYGVYLAYNCSELVSISLPVNLTGVIDFMIQQCPKMNYFVIPAGVTGITSAPIDVPNLIILSRTAYISDWGLAPENATVYAYAGSPAAEYGQECAGLKFVDLGASGSLASPIELTLLPMTVEAGVPTPLELIVYPENDYTFSWTSSDAGIATVSDGVITGLKDGTVNITVTAGNTSSTAAITVETPEFVLQPKSLQLMTVSAFNRYPLSVLARVNDVEIESWASSDTSVATVDANGCVMALKSGMATITAVSGSGSTASCEVKVAANAGILRLPYDVTEIQNEAFRGMISARYIYVPDGVTTIGQAAFAGCSDVLLVRLPASATNIAADAFSGCDQVCIVCPTGSVAQDFAAANGIRCIVQ